MKQFMNLHTPVQTSIRSINDENAFISK